MANQMQSIENAKVIKVGQYTFGNGNNGPWAKINVKLEWDVEYVEANDEKKIRKNSTIVTFWNEKAKWAKENIKAGNPYADQPIPDMFLNVWVSMKGDMTERNNGGEFIDNSNNVEYCTISEQKA